MEDANQLRVVAVGRTAQRTPMAASATDAKEPIAASQGYLLVRRRDMGRNVTISIGALILIVVLVAFIF